MIFVPNCVENKHLKDVYFYKCVLFTISKTRSTASLREEKVKPKIFWYLEMVLIWQIKAKILLKDTVSDKDV
jgi:hypothetical protein